MNVQIKCDHNHRTSTMKPVVKKTIITADASGRRYFVVRSSSRPGGRRYYVCSRPDCEARVTRESDFFCRAHSELKTADNEHDVSTKLDDADESILNDHSEIADEDMPSQDSLKEESEANMEEHENGHEIEHDNSMTENEVHENGNETLAQPTRQRVKSNRAVEVDDATGARSFRDSSGRRRLLCAEANCTNMLKRQTDIFCRAHNMNDGIEDGENNSSINEETGRVKKTRYSAPVTSDQPKENPPLLNNTITSTTQNGTNGNHSEEYESPEKAQERPGTKRSFRDASGRIRFLCSIPICRSRVHRQAETFCRRHQREFESQQCSSISAFITACVNRARENAKEENGLGEMNINHNNTNELSRQLLIEPTTKRRKYDSQNSISKSLNKSSNSPRNIVLSTTTLIDEQWNDILTMIRQFPQVQLSTNLVVNDHTTHLLVDDSEKSLHCTITKKIVQAAVRRHIFIISARWIRDCLHTHTFLDEHPFEILSDSHTTLRSSVQNFQNHNQYLFTSKHAFAIECRQCQGSINRNELVELIELSGAQLYDHDQIIDTLIVLCDTNEKNLAKIKEKYIPYNVPTTKYVTSDFLLKSIIKFEIQDIDKYAL
ncbi:unnamed protein product [Adineta ricciae]|uniref:BRCT domain-containing protein n=2 Tax=Adineta ricciae TaxID=249248 RepID=A0A813WR91_ADIRI|nr:unnamed protein product [Adineta ricciae]